MNSQWHIWQWMDSSFPTGAFTHSGGLEAAYQHGVVHDGHTLAKFIHTTLAQTRRGVLRFARDAREQDFAETDRDCDLFLSNHVANRASRAQGRAMLNSSSTTFALPQLIALQQQVRRDHLPGHTATVFSFVARELQLDWPTTVSIMLFQAAKNVVSAAVRLSIVGPMEGQRLLANAVEPVALDDAPAVQVSPVLDLLQGMQDRLYSRLFQS